MIWRIKKAFLNLLQHSLVLQGRSWLFRVFVLFSLATSLAITMLHLMEKGSSHSRQPYRKSLGGITLQKHNEPTKPCFQQ